MHSSFRRRVKIVGTLGPSSKSPEQIGALIEAGLDIARLNFSHGTHDFHKNLIQSVREASKKHKKPIAILQDLQGPKIRAGKLGKDGLQLKAGDTLLLYPEGATPKSSSHGKILVPISAEIAKQVADDTSVGNRILFDDGKISTLITHIKSPEIIVEVEVGGKLTDHKGMNLPGTPLTIPCLTEKDYLDLKFGLSQGVDAVALSFVRSSDDLEHLRAKLKKITNSPPILIAKIEREEAVDDMDQIVEVSDGILVARGDMAVELGAERVPAVQKRLIRSCNDLGVSVITATQMLESMITSPTPTRAEASDVANAVFDGTDAVMLSAETASGEYPVDAVETMARIVIEAERNQEFHAHPRELIPSPGSVVESIEFSASRIAHHVGAVAIACITHSGIAAKALAKFRPDTPIIAIMDNETALRKLAFVWGVRGVLIPEILATDDLFKTVQDVLKKNNFADAEDLVVVTAGIPTLRRGTTNMVKVHRMGATSGRDRTKSTSRT